MNLDKWPESMPYRICDGCGEKLYSGQGHTHYPNRWKQFKRWLFGLVTPQGDTDDR